MTQQLFFQMRWIVLVLFFGLWKGAVCQDQRSVNSLIEEANKYYDDEQYHLAIQLYRELTDRNVKTPDVSYHLAECYRKTFNYQDAEAYYLKVHYLAPAQYPLALYYYALMLKLNANFEESLTYFDEFILRNEKNAALKEYVEQAVIERAGSELARTEPPSTEDGFYILQPLNLNTDYNDYAPAVRDSTSLVITSGRVLSNRQSIDERYGEAFTDNYYFEKHAGTWEDKTRQLFNVVNSRYNDGSGCFNSKGDKYYFTVCGMDGPQCRIFVSALKNGKWSEPVVLNSNINFKSYEAKHPAISHGGDTLFFASNRPRGHGQYDIWMSVDSGDDEWGPAMNLGSSINTKLNELSPTFTAYSHVVFFASDGHQGYGGLDLYMAKRLSTGDTVLYNLDPPFNSSRDDCFISFSNHALYWSSNRPGNFDVLSVKIPSVLAFISRLSLKKRDARRNINLASKTENTQRLTLLASRLEERVTYDDLTYDKRRVVEAMIGNRMQNGQNTKALFADLSQKEFDILNRIAEERYQEYLVRKKYANQYLTRIRPAAGVHDLTVTGVLTDSLTNTPLVSRNIVLTDSLGEVLKITGTNENGNFRFTDVPSGQGLYLRLDKAIGQGVVRPIIKNLTIKDSQQQQQTVTDFENIYFDFDHYRIRPEAAKVLDALAAFLIRNPGVQVEIFAFADDRGSSDYNLRLTRKRGQSVVDYLIRKGVDETGLAITAKGKQAQQEVDNELQRQYNRRVEFYLNGNAEQISDAARTYILKKSLDWATLSKLTGITKEELKVLNGASEEQLKAFQPVRIPVKAKTVSPEVFFIRL